MADISTIRLNVALRELNISLDRAVEFLSQKDIEIEARPTAKISKDIYRVLLDEFVTDKSKKDASHEISEEKKKEKESLRALQEKKEQDRIELQEKRQEVIRAKAAVTKPVMIGKIDLNPSKIVAKPPVVKKPVAPKAPGVVTGRPAEKKESEVIVEQKATKKNRRIYSSTAS
jgi:translation initiation factor IF-2